LEGVALSRSVPKIGHFQKRPPKLWGSGLHKVDLSYLRIAGYSTFAHTMGAERTANEICSELELVNLNLEHGYLNCTGYGYLSAGYLHYIVVFLKEFAISVSPSYYQPEYVPP